MTTRVICTEAQIRRAIKAADATLQAYLPKASEACEKSVMDLYPQLKTIREIAAGGDEVLWVKVIDVVRKLEQDTEPHLQALRK